MAHLYIFNRFFQDLPPANVTSEVYHKHILPDLPGPLKMRQLLIWAIQKASKEMQEKSQAKRTKLSSANVNKDWEEMIAEPLIQALHTNELNTSWYQRPASGSTSSFRSNPINEEMKECLSLYQRYFKQLSTEYSQWKLIENSPIINADLESTQIDVETEVPSLASDIVSLNKWSSRLPLSIDRLGWLLNVYGSFEHRSRDFCEAVFKQIFDRFFADHQKGKLFAEPIQALKALSAAPSH